MESLDLYRKAISIAALGNKISPNPVKIADIYADLKAIQEDRISAISRLPSRDIIQD